MRIAICDDNRQELDKYHGLIEEIAAKHKISMAIDRYTGASCIIQV